MPRAEPCVCGDTGVIGWPRVASKARPEDEGVRNTPAVQHGLARHALHQAGEMAAKSAVHRLDGPSYVPKKHGIGVRLTALECSTLRRSKVSGIRPERPEPDEPPRPKEFPGSLQSKALTAARLSKQGQKSHGSRSLHQLQCEVSSSLVIRKPTV